MKNPTALISLFALLSPACGGAVESADTNAPPLSCELVDASATAQVFKFSDPDTVSPAGTECTSLGGGVFECKPDVCLALPYAGSCPHCLGGGE